MSTQKIKNLRSLTKINPAPLEEILNHEGFFKHFLYSQQSFVFNLQKDFDIVCDHIFDFFIFIFRKTLLPFASLFCKHSLFFDNI